tara:strand:+ start:199 stop:336 length:138 start_codon:yes stop_codon:yes gene_type:complete
LEETQRTTSFFKGWQLVLNAFFQAGPGEKQKNIKRNERKTTKSFC